MSKFLLLLGPSAVGKSVIIDELCKLDSRFIFISPFMTRPLRVGEKNKVSIGDEEMDERLARGEFIAVNRIYNTRYATPRLPIIQALAADQFPVLDWPVDQIHIMTQAFPGKTHVVYVAPPSLELLRERLARDGRDTEGKRLEHARNELKSYWSGMYRDACDFAVVTTENMIVGIAKSIYINYLSSFT